MHNCQKIEERLMDLVFDELNEDERKQTLAEVESCDHCRAEYQSFAMTLSVFDQASAAMTPDEQYWNGYEARLRAKLATDERPTLWQRLRETFSASMMRPAWAMSVALLLGIALLLWAVMTQTSDIPKPPQQANDKPEIVKPDEKDKEHEDKVGSVPEDKEEKQRNAQPEPDSQQKKASFHQPKQALATRRNNTTKQPQQFDKTLQTQTPIVAENVEQGSAGTSFVDSETLKHFEKAQLFLRAFRNIDSTESTSPVEIADDKQRSRVLLFKNVLLRREAAAKGNLPVEQVLSDLEPLLLDIANLSDKATPDDIRTIHERVQKREMIATLQVYAARPVIAKAISD
jgi:cytoskeletal protein RodZ